MQKIGFVAPARYCPTFRKNNNTGAFRLNSNFTNNTDKFESSKGCGALTNTIKNNPIAFTSSIIKNINMKKFAKGVVRDAHSMMDIAGRKGTWLHCNPSDRIDSYKHEIKSKAHDLYREMQDLYFNNGKDDNGKRVATISTLDSGKKLMEEYGADGSVSRRTIFDNDCPEVINILSTGEHFEFKACRDGVHYIQVYAKDSLASKDQRFIKISRFLKFNGDEELSILMEGFEKYPNGSAKIKELCSIEDGKLSEYQQDFKKTADGTIKVKLGFVFDSDGELTASQNNVKLYADGSSEAKKTYVFTDGKLSDYYENSKQSADGKLESRLRLVFEDEELLGYTKNYSNSEDENYEEVSRLLF